MQSVKQKAESFVALHERPGVFAIPNPWDAGSARILEGLGFDALATTSLGFAQTLGRPDGAVTLDEKLAHCRALAKVTNIPITADTENCFGDNPEAVGSCIRLVADAGIVGASVEDYTGDAQHPIYDFNLAVERVTAAVEAASLCDFPFTITARAEQLLRSGRDIDETIRRLQAYEAAGADVLYAPLLNTLEEVRLVSESVARPLNVLGTPFTGHTVGDLGAAGAKRVSVGGGLARLIAGTLIQTAERLRDHGDLSWSADVAPLSTVNELFALCGDQPEK